MTNRGMFWQMDWQAWPRLGFLLTGHGFTSQVHISAGSPSAMKGHRFLFGALWDSLNLFLGEADYS